VRDYTRVGDTVCDPFAGWGTTLASAAAYRRRAVGAERDEAAYREAVRRLCAPTQVDMFAEQESRRSMP
jgi:DNA modification methylase